MTEEAVVICFRCDCKLGSRLLLQRHVVESHSEECWLCGATFEHEMELRDHETFLHRAEHEGECSICHLRLPNSMDLDLLTRFSEFHNKDVIVCPVCSIDFPLPDTSLVRSPMARDHVTNQSQNPTPLSPDTAGNVSKLSPSSPDPDTAGNVFKMSPARPSPGSPGTAGNVFKMPPPSPDPDTTGNGFKISPSSPGTPGETPTRPSELKTDGITSKTILGSVKRKAKTGKETAKRKVSLGAMKTNSPGRKPSILKKSSGLAPSPKKSPPPDNYLSENPARVASPEVSSCDPQPSAKKRKANVRKSPKRTTDVPLKIGDGVSMMIDMNSDNDTDSSDSDTMDMDEALAANVSRTFSKKKKKTAVQFLASTSDREFVKRDTRWWSSKSPNRKTGRTPVFFANLPETVKRNHGQQTWRSKISLVEAQLTGTENARNFVKVDPDDPPTIGPTFEAKMDSFGRQKLPPRTKHEIKKKLVFMRRQEGGVTVITPPNLMQSFKKRDLTDTPLAKPLLHQAVRDVLPRKSGRGRKPLNRKGPFAGYKLDPYPDRWDLTETPPAKPLLQQTVRDVPPRKSGRGRVLTRKDRPFAGRTLDPNPELPEFPLSRTMKRSPPSLETDEVPGTSPKATATPPMKVVVKIVPNYSLGSVFSNFSGPKKGITRSSRSPYKTQEKVGFDPDSVKRETPRGTLVVQKAQRELLSRALRGKAAKRAR